MSSMYPSFGGAAVRPCMRCGAPLASNESQCSRCGTLNPLPQGQQPGMFQQGQQSRSSGPSWGTQPPQSPQFPVNGANDGRSDPAGWGSTGQAGGWQQNSLFSGQNRSPSQPLQNNLFGNNGTGYLGQGQSAPNNRTGALGQSQSSPNNGFSNFQQNPNNNFFSVTQQKGYGASPLGTMNSPTRRGYRPDTDDEGNSKKRPNAGVVVLIIVLLIAVVGGGGFFGYKLLKKSTTTAGTNVTPVVITTPTGTPVFSDSFKDNGSNWNANAPTGTKFSISNGKMILESDNQGVVFPEILPGNKTFDNFRIDVDAALAKGDNTNGYGIYIRASSTQDSPLGQYYRFEVYGDGNFVIYKGTRDANGNTTSTSLKQSLKPSDAVYTNGTLNHLTVIANGTQLSFYINNTNVSTFTDTTYKSGAVALFVSDLKPPANGSSTPSNQPAMAQATFEHLAVFPPQ